MLSAGFDVKIPVSGCRRTHNLESVSNKTYLVNIKFYSQLISGCRAVFQSSLHFLSYLHKQPKKVQNVQKNVLSNKKGIILAFLVNTLSL